MVQHMQPGTAIRQVLDFCYPSVCAACGVSCPESTTLNCCTSCDCALQELADSPACEKCAKPLAYDRAPCPYCEGRGFRPLQRIVCLGVFDDPLKHLIHQVKYHGQWALAEQLADRLLACDRMHELLASADVLVPVPLHPIRQIARGYNQADVIAQRISKRVKRPLKHPAIRIRNTETQTHLHSRAKRVENLRGAFALIDAKSIVGRHVVVIDDVTTTGATLRSFARMLMNARPASVSALVVAIADPRGKGFESI